MRVIESIFQRNQRAGDSLEIFLVTAVASVLVVRFGLFITGYPSIGGDSLHIAHMLWGGLLMLVAQVLLLAFLGHRLQRVAAFIGGAGFGIFIDELGKFITRDNNYFFQPTIGLIYGLFCLLFIAFRYIGHRAGSRLSDKEYTLNAVTHIEEAILDDLDDSEKQRALNLLAMRRAPNALSEALEHLINDLPARETAKPGLAIRWRDGLAKAYRSLLHRRQSRRLFSTLFIIEAVIFALASLSVTGLNIIELAPGLLAGTVPTQDVVPTIGELLATIVAVVLVSIGAARMSRSRIGGLHLLSSAVQVQIFFSSFFQFYREEFAALPALLLHVGLYVVLRFAIDAEKRIALAGGETD